MNFSEFFSRRADDGQYSALFIRFFLLSAVVLFALTHAPINFVASWYDRAAAMLSASGFIAGGTLEFLTARKETAINDFIVPVRTWLFFLALMTVLYPLANDIRRHIRNQGSIYRDPGTYLHILIPFGFLCLLVMPTQLGLGGNTYARMSLDPLNFNDQKLWFYQRLLMPALAYYLQLKGPLLYFIFSLSVTVLMFLLVHLFFLTRGMKLTKLELVSLGSSSFLISQLLIPGYTEQLALVFLLLLFIVPTGIMGRMSLIVLSLLAHETSIVPLVFIAWLFFSRKEQMMITVIIAFYCFFWIASFGGNIPLLLSVRDVYGKSGLQWALEHPLRLLAGIALSYKLLWAVIIFGIFTFRQERFLLAGSIAIAVGFTLIGVDTSRLMGFGILSLLVSLYMLKRNASVNLNAYRYYLIANIIVPTFFIGTNIGIALVNGIYATGGEAGTIVLNGLYQILYLGVVAP